MNYTQFAASFQGPEESEERLKGRVVLAGTIMAATDEFCRIEINGAHYDIPSSDIIDIQHVPEPGPSDGDQTDDTESPPDDVSKTRRLQLALITVNPNTVLCHRIPAAVIAAMGTWVLVLPAVKPA